MTTTNAGGVILISERIHTHEILFHLTQTFKTKKVVKETSAAGPDIIVPTVMPSLAAVILDFRDEKRQIVTIMEQLESVQTKFRNAYGICIGCDLQIWHFIQESLSGGSLRLIRVTSAAEGARHLLDIYNALRDTAKLNLQRSFFELEHQQLTAPKTATKIALDTHRNLGIPDDDARLILDGFPSLKSIVTASSDHLASNSPADLHSINRLTNFFSAKH